MNIFFRAEPNQKYYSKLTHIYQVVLLYEQVLKFYV